MYSRYEALLNCVHISELKRSSALLVYIYTLTIPPSYTCTGAGVPHIVEQILQSLDAKSLVMSDQVSSIWRDTIENLRIWKHMIKHKINSNQLWRGLFKRREW